MNWSLQELLGSLHKDVESKLGIARSSFKHPGTLGDASEKVWLDVLQTYLPKRYSVAKAHVVDSDGKFSQQIDVVIFDRQYTPFIFHHAGESVVPAEGVYAVFEAKQTASLKNVKYATDKVSSVRNLKRTSLPIPHAGGTYDAKEPEQLLGGLLTLDSEWTPAMGSSFKDALEVESHGALDLGCVAAHGYFHREAGAYQLIQTSKPATAFLFALINRLQLMATVPRIDLQAYAKWL